MEVGSLSTSLPAIFEKKSLKLSATVAFAEDSFIILFLPIIDGPDFKVIDGVPSCFRV